MTILNLREQHIENQVLASDPSTSVWVTANAGAGKTRVLVDRIIRMLLPPFNTVPSKILCMTFTKAAAAEMSDRLFGRLGQWIALDDNDLSQEIEYLTRQTPNSDDLISARRLFAKALETPGGLKIQTIHAFCETILRRFPVEAGIPPDFTVIQEGDIRKILAKALDDLSSSNSKELNNIISHLGLNISLNELLLLLVDSYNLFSDMEKPFNVSEIAKIFELPIDKNTDIEINKFIQKIDWIFIDSCVSAFKTGTKADILLADKLKNLKQNRYASENEIFFLLEKIFLTTKKDISKKLGTKKIHENFPELMQRFHIFASSYKQIFDKIELINLYHNNEYIHSLMAAVFHYYHQIKQDESLFDFQDMIQKTKNLLCNEDLSAWVLYKLDGGIDHILVDEAQDTSPEQWEIIRAITEEFFSNEDTRTIFAVGDEKQSIYSFQGADPYQMPKNRDYYSDAVGVYEKKWLTSKLKGSFRSAPAITNLVDHIFSNPDAAKGVQFEKLKKLEHHAIANQGPGYIKLNPPIIPLDDIEKSVWTTPLDEPLPEDAKNILVKNIVSQIKTILSEKNILPSTKQQATPKDILILLRKRGDLQKLFIKELKKQNIPTAGADRVNLMDSIAVIDLLSAMKFVLSPNDDLNLASLLKSPLCGLSEKELFKICYNRTGLLWIDLKNSPDQDYKKAFNFIKEIKQSKFQSSPYDFLQNILISLKGKKKLVAQLGNECLEAIDELLNKSLIYEQDYTPSIQGFLHYISKEGSNTKKDPDQNADEIRIMTVHGAKGLEAPIVFLPDTASIPTFRYHDSLTSIEQIDCPIWLRGKQNSEIIKEIKQKAKDADMCEYRRLLYVALTRAKDRLYIDGILGKKQKLSDQCWYHYIREGIKKIDNVDIQNEDSDYPIYIHSDDLPQPIEINDNCETKKQIEPIPYWAKENDFKSTTYEEEYLNPSKIGKGSIDIKLNNFAIIRGNIIHKILELIPQIPKEKRENSICMLLDHYNLNQMQKEQIKEQILKLINHQDMDILLGENGLSEVPIIGKVESLDKSVSGQIDRMVILDNKIILADYKSDANLTDISDVKNDYIIQMILYKEALKELYPNKIITCLIIGTKNACIINLDDKLSMDIKNYL